MTRRLLSAEDSAVLSFCVLGSGSLGNSSALVLRSGDSERCILIDCGFGPRTTARRLADFGIALASVEAIVLTHADADHFKHTWVKTIRKRGLPIFVHPRHRLRLLREGLGGRSIELMGRHVDLGGDTHVETIPLAHDETGSMGLVIEHGGVRIGWATDLGRVPRTLLDAFVDLDALAIESNYDPALQLGSSRPAFLKRRIMGGRGHLSNEESIEAVVHVASRSRGLSHIVALHLSRECNDPRLVRRLYRERARTLLDRLTITRQERPSPLLHVERHTGRHMRRPRAGEQLAMF